MKYSEFEKKYKIRHKFIKRNENYLNYDGNFEFNTGRECLDYMVEFSEKQLKLLAGPKFYRTLLDEDIYEWEEVE